MTKAEETLRDGLEDAIIAFELLEATLRECRQAPIADIVMQFKNKAAAALDLGTRPTITTEEKTT
jgi:hypothetical protein